MYEVTVKKLEKLLFTTSKPDELIHTCVVAFYKEHAVSFRHGAHSTLEKNEKVILYNVQDPTLQFETVVTAISDNFDIIVFKLVNGRFPNYPDHLSSMYREMTYKQLSISPNREPIWRDGTVLEQRVCYCVGTSHRDIDDSGSAIFDEFGQLCGISIGKNNELSRSIQNMTLGENAERNPEINIINSGSIMGIGGITDPDDPLQSERRPPFQVPDFSEVKGPFSVVSRMCVVMKIHARLIALIEETPLFKVGLKLINPNILPTLKHHAPILSLYKSPATDNNSVYHNPKLSSHEIPASDNNSIYPYT